MKRNITKIPLNPIVTENKMPLFLVVLCFLIGRKRIKKMFHFLITDIDQYAVDHQDISVKKGRLRYNVQLFHFKDQTVKMELIRHL